MGRPAAALASLAAVFSQKEEEGWITSAARLDRHAGCAAGL
jgi:hypothetical protein